jgi:hypothetical protein
MSASAMIRIARHNRNQTLARKRFFDKSPPLTEAKPAVVMSPAVEFFKKSEERKSFIPKEISKSMGPAASSAPSEGSILSKLKTYLEEPWQHSTRVIFCFCFLNKILF